MKILNKIILSIGVFTSLLVGAFAQALDPVVYNLSHCVALAQAITNDDLHRLRQLLKTEVSANTLLTDGQTCILFYALAKNKLEAAQILIDEGADVNIKTSIGQSILGGLIALIDTSDSVEAIKLLLTNGMNTRNISPQGYSAIYYSIKYAGRTHEIEKIHALIDAGAQLDDAHFEDRATLALYFDDANRRSHFRKIKTKLLKQAALKYLLLEQSLSAEFEISLFQKLDTGVDVVLGSSTEPDVSYFSLMGHFEQFLELQWTDKQLASFLVTYFRDVRESIQLAYNNQFEELERHIANEKPASLNLSVQNPRHAMAMAVDVRQNLAASVNMVPFKSSEFEGLTKGLGLIVFDIEGKNEVFAAHSLMQLATDVWDSSLSQLVGPQEAHRIVDLFELPRQTANNCAFVSPRGTFFAHLIFAIARYRGVDLRTATRSERFKIAKAARLIFNDFALFSKMQTLIEFMNYTLSGLYPEGLVHAAEEQHPLLAQCTIERVDHNNYITEQSIVGDFQMPLLIKAILQVNHLKLGKPYSIANYTPVQQLREGLDAGDQASQQCPHSAVRETVLAWIKKR